MSTTAEATIDVRVWRGGEKGEYQSFAVPRRDSQTVLDVVTWIQRHADPTLAYRFACRVGVTVNGRPRWTCRTHVSKVIEDGRVEIGPLANLPVIRDLAADLTPFFEKWQKAEGTFVPSRTRHEPLETISPESPERQAAINCGVCYAACDTVRWSPEYFGPAALNRSWSLVNDVRDAGNLKRLAAAASNGGCHNCHSHQSCEQLCPQGLNPTASIAGLKRRTMQAYIRGEIS